MARSPIVVPAVVTLLGVVLLLGLAIWQVQRAAWKDGLIAERSARMSQAPAALPATLADPGAWEFRPVVVVGRFDHEHETVVLKPASDGRSGYHVVTPLILAGGGAVLVDRGWVPLERRDPASRTDGQVEGAVQVEGIVRLGDTPGVFTPDNDPVRGDWYWIDPLALAAAAGIRAPALVVEATGGTLPEGGQTAVDLPNRHRGYAATWAALAVTLAVIYLVYRRRQGSRT